MLEFLRRLLLLSWLKVIAITALAITRRHPPQSCNLNKSILCRTYESSSNAGSKSAIARLASSHGDMCECGGRGGARTLTYQRTCAFHCMTMTCRQGWRTHSCTLYPTGNHAGTRGLRWPLSTCQFYHRTQDQRKTDKGCARV